MFTYVHTDARIQKHMHTSDMCTSTRRTLGAISRRKTRRMGEDGRRNERHRENGGEGGTRGVEWSHEQEEAERGA